MRIKFYYKIILIFLIGYWIFSGCTNKESDPHDCWSQAPDNYRKYTITQPEGEFLGQDYVGCLFGLVVSHYSDEEIHGYSVLLTDSSQKVASDTIRSDENAIRQILKPANWKLVRVSVLNYSDSNSVRSFRFVGRWQREDILSSQTMYSIWFSLVHDPEGHWLPYSDSKYHVKLVIGEFSESINETKIIESTRGIYPRTGVLTSNPPFHYLTTRHDSNVTFLDQNGSQFKAICKRAAADSLYLLILKEFEFMPFNVSKRNSFKSLFMDIDIPIPDEYQTMNWKAFAELIRKNIHDHWNIATCSIWMIEEIPSFVYIRLTPKSVKYNSAVYLISEIRNQQWFLIYSVFSSHAGINFPSIEKHLFGEG